MTRQATPLPAFANSFPFRSSGCHVLATGKLGEPVLAKAAREDLRIT
jgi:hypothetical protein